MALRHRGLVRPYLRTTAAVLSRPGKEVRYGGTPQPARDTRALPRLMRHRELHQFINILRGVDVHDAVTQLFALPFPDYVAA